MHIAEYLGLVRQSERRLAAALEEVGRRHPAEVRNACALLASFSQAHLDRLTPSARAYDGPAAREVKGVFREMSRGPRRGPLAVLSDLHDLWLLACQVKLCWMVLDQVARVMRDAELEQSCTECMPQTEQQISWLLGRLRQAAPA